MMCTNSAMMMTVYACWCRKIESFFSSNNIFLCEGDDNQALIWDIQQMPQSIDVPILAYAAQSEINQVQWSVNQSDWIAICFKDNVEILRV